MTLIDDETLMIAFDVLYERNDDIVKKQGGLSFSLENLLQIIRDQPEAHDSECIPIRWIKQHPRFPRDEAKARVLNDMIESWYAEEWGDYWGD